MIGTCETATRGATLLKVNNVCLSFGNRIVLRDVNATITDLMRPDCVTGQVVCFLGPSGIGKTQLCRIIAGLQRPTSGHVMVDDRINTIASGGWADVTPGKVGMVPQNYPLFEFATVQDNLYIAGKQAGLSQEEVRKKAAVYIEAFQLEDHLDDYPCALSGGTRQRVAIIRQLMCSGFYVVMDEPFSGLDPVMKRKASDVITRVANLDERNTVIVVTHDVTEGMSIADTVWLMGREPGKPGARLVMEFDMVALGLYGRENIQADPEFQKFVVDVKNRFSRL